MGRPVAAFSRGTTEPSPEPFAVFGAWRTVVRQPTEPSTGAHGPVDGGCGPLLSLSTPVDGLVECPSLAPAISTMWKKDVDGTAVCPCVDVHSVDCHVEGARAPRQACESGTAGHIRACPHRLSRTVAGSGDLRAVRGVSPVLPRSSPAEVPGGPGPPV